MKRFIFDLFGSVIVGTGLSLPVIAQTGDSLQFDSKLFFGDVLDSHGLDSELVGAVPFVFDRLEIIRDVGADGRPIRDFILVGHLNKEFQSFVLDQVRSGLPDMGCKDRIDVRSDRGRASAYFDRDTGHLDYFFEIYGSERACDWPFGTYLNYNVDVKLEVSANLNVDELAIAIAAKVENVDVDWSDYGKFAREIFRAVDDLLDLFQVDMGFEAFASVVNERAIAIMGDRELAQVNDQEIILNANALASVFSQDETNLSGNLLHWSKLTGIYAVSSEIAACETIAASGGVVAMIGVRLELQNFVEALVVETFVRNALKASLRADSASVPIPNDWSALSSCLTRE
jgi:hypothetical protein